MNELRNRIDAIDADVLRLLNERAGLALEIGGLKRADGAPFYVPEREHEVYERLESLNEGPLKSRALRAIWREIISAIRTLEEPVSVGYLGPRDTFSHLAAKRVFGSHAEFHPVATIADVFTEVERSRLDYGMVPVETSAGGAVSDTLDRFVTSELKIVNELLLHVREDLLANCAFEEIVRLYSGVRPFAQCRNWIKANLPKAELVEVSSTAEAARIAADEPGAAAIASSLAAETYGLKILVPGIEDMAHNYTRFFVLGRQSAKPTGKDKTAIMFWVNDEPGALYKLLVPLADQGVNLTKIESRPSQRRAWEYVFFIDLMGHMDDPVVAQALDGIRAYCKELRVLGSFPQGVVGE